ncbi:MAG: hypothetical protein NVS2B4_12830 [Ramlibacter sp.]
MLDKTFSDTRFGQSHQSARKHRQGQATVSDSCTLCNLALEDRQRLCKPLAKPDRSLQVARTVADLAGSPQVDIAHLAEAVQDRRIPA